jgi:hypothetical protein
MIRHVYVDIRRNEGATVRNSFPAWEIPILKVVHGEDAITVMGEKLVNREPPEAHDEFTRLNNRYRRGSNEDGSQGTPYVHMVYGELGVQKLQQAIEAAVTAAPQGDLTGFGEPISSVGG